MGKWLDLARELEAKAEGNSGNYDNFDKRPVSPPVAASDHRFGKNDNFDKLSPYLARLRSMPVPSGADAVLWPQIAADALTVWTRWAGQASALGWSAHDLFGRRGLAVWMKGRRLVLIDAKTAIVTQGSRSSVFYRRGHQDDDFIWDHWRPMDVGEND